MISNCWQRSAPGWAGRPCHVILLSSVVGAVCGIALMLIKRRGREVAIPFGPTRQPRAGSHCCGEALTNRYLSAAGLN